MVKQFVNQVHAEETVQQVAAHVAVEQQIEDQIIARRMAQQAIFLSGGTLVESGPLSKVLYDPDRAETRQFLEFYGFAPEPPPGL